MAKISKSFVFDMGTAAVHPRLSSSAATKYSHELPILILLLDVRFIFGECFRVMPTFYHKNVGREKLRDRKHAEKPPYAINGTYGGAKRGGEAPYSIECKDFLRSQKTWLYFKQNKCIIGTRCIGLRIVRVRISLIYARRNTGSVEPRNERNSELLYES